MREGSSQSWIRQSRHALAILGCVAGLAIAFFAFRQVNSGSETAARANLPGNSVGTVSTHQLQAEGRRLAEQQTEALLAQLKQTPRDPALLASIAGIYYQARELPEAAEYYKKSLTEKEDPDIRTKLGGVYFYSGDWDRAIAEFERVLKTDPKNVNALFDLGVTRWQGKNDAEGAIAAWQRLLEENPNHPRRAEVEGLILLVKKHAGIAPDAKVQNPGT